jgi:hypothetical protein
LLGEWGVAQMFEMSNFIAARLEAIAELERLTTKIKSLELKEIHPVLENNLWLVDERYELWSSNEQLQTFLERALKAHRTGDTERPDFIVRGQRKQYVVIELKAGNSELTNASLTQILDYISTLKRRAPQARFDGIMIGGAVDTASPALTTGDSRVELRTYAEVLDDARYRYTTFKRSLRERIALAKK